MTIIPPSEPSLTPTSKPVHVLSLEARKTLAVEHYRNAPGRPNLTDTARKFGVSRSGLGDRLNGVKTRNEAREAQQKLKPHEEQVLLEWIRHWGARGIPMTSHTIRAKAIVLAGQNIAPGWIYRFRKRHGILKSVWSSTIDGARARQVNPTVVQEFYDILIKELIGKNIPPENIFNMDEKGIVCGQHDRVKVWVDQSQKNTVLIGSKERELTTVIECICADGQAIRPMIIFKGVRQSKQWCSANDNGLKPM